MSPVWYGLTDEQFDGLAAGYGDRSAMTVLAEGQLTKRRLMLAALLDEVSAVDREAAGMGAAVDLLVEVERARPDIVTDVLGQPFVDAWVTACLRRLDGAVPAGAGRALTDELGQLSALAAAAAARAGLSFAIEVPTFGESVHLATLGTAGGLGAGWARVAGDRSRFTVTGANGAVVAPGATTWFPRLVVEVEAGYVVAVEDQDPYRHCYGYRPLPRLDARAAAAFAVLLTAAWQLIVDEHPQHAEAMRVGLRAVVPLRPPDGTGTVSATSRHASGAVAIGIPETAGDLGLLLLHEFMHVKLGTVLDLVDLYKDGSTGFYQAPWRLDPRPVEALLQGTYAHLGVTDYWRVRRTAPDVDVRFADVEFAYWRAQNWIATRTLMNCPELTEYGRRFVHGLRSSLRAWQREKVGADVATGVEAMMLAQDVRWRLRNWLPGPDEVGQVLRAWQDGGDLADIRPGGVLARTQDAEAAGMPGLVGGIRAALAGRPVDTFDSADAALLAGDRVAAARGYLHRLRRHDSDEDAWIGLAVALAGSVSRPDATVDLLCRRPELIRAAVAASGSWRVLTDLVCPGSEPVRSPGLEDVGKVAALE